MSSDVYLETL